MSTSIQHCWKQNQSHFVLSASMNRGVLQNKKATAPCKHFGLHEPLHEIILFYREQYVMSVLPSDLKMTKFQDFSAEQSPFGIICLVCTFVQTRELSTSKPNIHVCFKRTENFLLARFSLGLCTFYANYISTMET